MVEKKEGVAVIGSQRGRVRRLIGQEGWEGRGGQGGSG